MEVVGQQHIGEIPDEEKMAIGKTKLRWVLRSSWNSSDWLSLTKSTPAETSCSGLALMMPSLSEL